MHRPSSPPPRPGSKCAPSSHTEDGIQMNAPGQRNPSLCYACSVPAHFPPSLLHLHCPIPTTQCGAGLTTAAGNIFILLPSFPWPCYIRKFASAQGREVEGVKNSEFVPKTPSSFLSSYGSLSTIRCPQDDGRLSHRRAGQGPRTAPLFTWNESLKVTHWVSDEVRAQVLRDSCVSEECVCELLNPWGQFFFLSYLGLD